MKISLLVLGSFIFATCFATSQSQIYSNISDFSLEDITEITYEISVKNTGTTKMTDVVLVDTLPKDTFYVKSRYLEPTRDTLTDPTIIRNDDGTTRSITWSLNTFEKNQTKQIELVVRHKRVTGFDYTKNEVQAIGTRLETPGRGPSIKVSNTLESLVNGNVTYRIIVLNNGQTILKGVTLRDELPYGLNCSSNCTDTTLKSELIPRINNKTPAWNAMWKLEEMLPGESVTVHLGAFVVLDVADLNSNKVRAQGIYVGPAGNETVSDETDATVLQKPSPSVT